MDIQQIVSQFAQSAAEDPSHFKQFGIDPAAAIKNATGFDLNEEELEDAVGAISSLVGGEGLDMGKAAELVGDVLNDSDVLGKLSELFGGK